MKILTQRTQFKRLARISKEGDRAIALWQNQSGEIVAAKNNSAATSNNLNDLQYMRPLPSTLQAVFAK